MHPPLPRRAAALALALALSACGELPSAQDARPEAEPPRPTVEAEDEPEPAAVVAVDPDDRRGIAREGYIAARHILIKHQGVASRSSRSEAEARELAEQLRARVIAGEDFSALARDFSDDSTAARGGDLGAFTEGAMVGPFEQAAFLLEEGAVSAVVETRYGFHIIERYPLQEVRLVHVLTMPDPPAAWAREDHRRLKRAAVAAEEAAAEAAAEATAGEPLAAQDEPTDGAADGAADEPDEAALRAAARARAEEARSRLLAGEDPAAVTRDLSDGPMALRGGDAGWIQRGQMAPVLDEPAFALSPGDVSEVIESGTGFHVLLRVE